MAHYKIEPDILAGVTHLQTQAFQRPRHSSTIRSEVEDRNFIVRSGRTRAQRVLVSEAHRYLPLGVSTDIDAMSLRPPASRKGGDRPGSSPS